MQHWRWSWGVLAAWGCVQPEGPPPTETLTIEDTGPPVEPAVCGDGVVEGGEICDDGNVVDADFCRSDCLEAGDLTLIDETTVWGRTLEGILVVGVLSNQAPLELAADPDQPVQVDRLGEHCAIEAQTGSILPDDRRNPPGAFVHCSKNEVATCGVTADGEVACPSMAGEPPYTRAPFVEVAPSRIGRACAVDDFGQLLCWGPDADKDIRPLTTLYTTVVSGVDPEFCTVTSGRLWCTDQLQVAFSGKDFVQAAAGDQARCGLHADGKLVCRYDEKTEVELPHVVDVSLLGRTLCALLDTGAVDCRRLGR